MKKLISIICTVALLFSLVACGQGSSKESDNVTSTESKIASTNDNPKYTIGLSVGASTVIFYQGVIAMAEQVAEENNVELLIAVADNDASRQQSQIEDFITRGVDAVTVIPVDPDAISLSFKKLKDAGIPVIALDRLPNDTTYCDVTIACDEELVGKAIIDGVIEGAEKYGIAKEDLKIIELVGGLKDNSAVLRSKGINKYADEYNLNIIAQVSTEWNNELLYSRLNDAIEAVDGDFNAIIGPADSQLPTTMSVLDSRNMWHKLDEADNPIIIVTGDGAPVAVQYIEEGYSYATANTDAFDYGRLAVEKAIEVIENGPPAEKMTYVPVLPLNLEAITEAGDTIWGNVFEVQ